MRGVIALLLVIAVSLAYAEEQAQPTCQRGAFIDAMSLLNAAVRASKNAPQDAAIAQAELDSILRIAIRQAAAAYPCARGTLQLGYDQNYAQTVRVAREHARARRMAPDVVEAADKLAAEILANGAPASDGRRASDAVPRLPGPFVAPSQKP